MACACLLLLQMPLLSAQTTAPPEDTIEALSQELRQAGELSAEEQAHLASELDTASEALESATALQDRAKEVARLAQNSEAETARFEALTREATEAPVPVPDADMSLEELEAEIQLLVAERRSATARRAAIDASLAAAGRQDSSERDRLVRIQGQLASLPGSPTPVSAPLQERVKGALSQARREQLSAEADLLALQVRSQPVLDTILTAERNWLDVKINRQDRRLEALADAAKALRHRVAQRQIEEARDIASELSAGLPALRTLAEENVALAREQESLSAELNAARRRILELRETLDTIERDASLSRRRLAISGLQPELADVMLTRLRTLPGRRSITSQIEARNRRINQAAIAAIDNGEAIRTMSDRAATLQARFPEAADWENEARDALDRLLSQRMQLLRDNAQTQSQLQQVLIDTNELAGSLFEAIQAYEEFLTSNLLWTRNYRYIDPARLGEQMRQLVSTRGLRQLGDRLPQAALQIGPLLLGLLVALLLIFRSRIKEQLEQQLGRPIRPRDERSRRILSGMGLSVAYTLPVPLAVLVAALVIGNAAGDNAQLSGISTGLAFSSLLLLCFGLLRHITGRFGVGRRLLKWNGQKMDCLRPALSWLAPVVVTGGFFTGFGLSTMATESGGPLTAIATLAITLALLLFGLRALRSRLFHADRTILFGFRAAVLLSAAIAIMHLTGHLFAAHLYLKSLGLSIAAFLLVLFATNTLYRVALIFNARIERRTREGFRELEDSGEATADNAEDLAAVASLSGANTQLLRLLRFLGLAVALWLVWSPALPALNIFNDIGLWSVADSTLPEGQLRTVSLATLINAIFILIITSLVTRHLPPLIDVLLMEWTATTPGSRYAIRMLMQYVIIGTGLAISLSLLGWEWSKVQWLVAALGVGIGFGLQEIVANFISGLILLFERPIRVGDIITAGGGDGTVTKINARATVIESFEGKELMVPNKELITGVVTNWSLSTSNLRVVIPVGVAYGSDVSEAMRILIEVAHDNVSVLDEPAPTATFEDFGDNALMLWLRCYAEREYPRVWTELRTAINERFNAAGISIAFPQRDVHLDADRPIPVSIVETAGSGPDGAGPTGT